MFTKEQLTRLSLLFNQLGELFNEVANNQIESVTEVAPTNIIEMPVKNVDVQPPLVPTEEVETPAVEVETEEEIDLDSMTIAELRKLAKSLGVDTKGKKSELIERIMSTQEEEEIAEETVVEEEIEELDEDSTEVEVDALDDEDEEEDEPTLQDKVEEALADLDLDELKDILEESGLSTKGKRQALISRIVDGVEQGIIEFEDDEVEESDEDEDITEDDLLDEDIIEDEEEIDIDLEDEEDEDLSIREQVQGAIRDDMRKQYAQKEITDKEISKFLDSYTNGRFKSVNKKRSLDKYIEIHTDLVDDDGDVHDFEDPYLANGKAHCCASELKELENGNLYCEKCGSEYEI